jgi:hypothetical protein
MAEFKSWTSYGNFKHFVENKNRYIRNQESEKFLETVLETSEKRKRILRRGKILWRSQLGHDLREPYDYQGVHFDAELVPFSPDRMKPLRNKASEGRLNPKGIPCLHLSTDKNTAMSEIRPWVGSLISIGQFKILKDLIVIDCSPKPIVRKIYVDYEPPPEEREQFVWSDIERAFAEPINPNDQTADYVPTQIIAELFKNKGFDGIYYKSALGEGHNIALFDLDVAEIISYSLFEAKSVSFNFEKVSNTYK